MILYIRLICIQNLLKFSEGNLKNCLPTQFEALKLKKFFCIRLAFSDWQALVPLCNLDVVFQVTLRKQMLMRLAIRNTAGMNCFDKNRFSSGSPLFGTFRSRSQFQFDDSVHEILSTFPNAPLSSLVHIPPVHTNPG